MRAQLAPAQGPKPALTCANAVRRPCPLKAVAPVRIRSGVPRLKRPWPAETLVRGLFCCVRPGPAETGVLRVSVSYLCQNFSRSSYGRRFSGVMSQDLGDGSVSGHRCERDQRRVRRPHRRSPHRAPLATQRHHLRQQRHPPRQTKQVTVLVGLRFRQPSPSPLPDCADLRVLLVIDVLEAERHQNTR